MWRLMLAVVSIVLWLSPVWAAKRVALLIGNAAYQVGGLRLRNPVHDATDMARALEKLGFTVETLTDASRRAMITAISDFGDRLAQSQTEVGLFYYSGHGVQSQGRNYLIPVGAKIRKASELEFEAVNAQRVLANMADADSQLNLVILDACRDNPYTSWGKNLSRGLTRMSGIEGSIIAYATQPNNVALDGHGRNSPYATALLKYVGQPGLTVQDMLNQVGLEVKRATRGRQVPWSEAAPMEDYCLAGCQTPAAPAGASAPSSVPDPETAMWAVVQDSREPSDFQAFLEAYPRGRFAPAARLQLRRLQRNDPPRLVLSRAEIRHLQSRLQRLGLNPGPSDGIWGSRTEAAVRQFQSRQGLPVTGRVDTRTYEQLKVAVGVYSPPVAAPAWPATLRDDQGIEFVRIAAGSFMMGSTPADVDRVARQYYTNRKWIEDELPQHRVQISQPFYLGKYEVTQGQWEKVMGSNPSRFKGDPNRPVEQVSWHDVQDFIKRLNAREGREIYRLPTEAEWEYAARSGTTTEYHFGNDASQLGRYAWYWDNSGEKTHPVGQLRPNAWGLYDMHGNVDEWVQDWKGSYPRGSVTDPTGPSTGSDWVVVRGGGWFSFARRCRSASRGAFGPGFRDDILGFRLLRTAP